MFCLSAVDARVLFQEEKRVEAEKQARKLQKQQQEGDNQEDKANQKAEQDVHVSAGCFSCYLLHYLRALIAHFLLRPVTPEQAAQRAIKLSRTASSAARPNW